MAREICKPASDFCIESKIFIMMRYNKSLFPFESKWIQIENYRIHYVDEGKGQILLFSHAALGSSFMYRRFIKSLSQHFRCIALDYPGFGLSTDHPHQKYSVITQSRILKQVIQKLELQEIIAMGHDTGGPSLFKVAKDQPELFKGLILTDTIIFPTFEYRRIHLMLQILGFNFVRKLNETTNFIMKLTVTKGVVTRKLSNEEKAEYYKISASSKKRFRITQLLCSLRENPDFMQSIKDGFEKELNEKPALLIYGENDPVTQLGIPDRIHAMLENAELFFIKNEGHFPHEGQPERMCEIIFQWTQNLNNHEKPKFKPLEISSKNNI